MNKFLPWLSLAVLALGLADTAPAQQRLSIATGGTGGVYYPLGGGLSELIGQHIEGHTAVAEVTGGSVENLALIHRGESDIAFSLADTAVQAYRGEGRFARRQLENLRVIAALYPNAVHLVALADSPVHALGDLRGRRVGVGAPGSGTEINVATLLQANGMSLRDLRARRLNFNETADALRDGDIAAGFWSVAPPTSAIMSLAVSRDIRLVGLTEAEIDRATAHGAAMFRHEIPGGTYDGIDQPVLTVGIPNLLVVHADMPDELAHAITRVLFENLAALRGIHAAMNTASIEYSLATSPLPFHPGAAGFYSDAGHDVPDHLMQ